VNQQFFDRERELAWLEELYRRDGAQLVVLYGRRRIGKTELLRRFASGKKAVYLYCERTSARDNLARFRDLLADALGVEFLRGASFPDWEPLFKAVQHILERERVVIVFDEFPYLVDVDPSLPSKFQRLWDEVLSRTKAFLVLCGSSVSVMENEVLGYRSPLYGRRTGSWKLGELPLSALKFFYPRPFEERLYVYGVAGGVPMYLKRFDPSEPFWSNVEREFFTKGGFLYEEAEFLLRQELREPRNYFLILRAIADGRRKLGEIANETGLDKAATSRYLHTLELLGLVGHEIPVLEPPKARKRLYHISDNYLAFWFGYVQPRRALVEQGMGGAAVEEVKALFPQYMSRVYEQAARRVVQALHPGYRVGRQWGKAGGKAYEIDIMAVGPRGDAIYGEVKWSEAVDCAGEKERLREKALPGLKPAALYIFAKSYRRREPGCLDLADVERIVEANGL